MGLQVVQPDIISDKGAWFYNDTVKEHFFNPRNLVMKGEIDFDPDGLGMVGSPACGDAMKIWIKIDENERLKECKWQTFGCASAIASTSMMSVMATENSGMTVNQALAMKPMDIMNRLGGLPTRKFHCSVLGDKALRSAINDYFRRTGQTQRIVVEGAKIVDKNTKTTDKDIEEAVLEGAVTIDDVQRKLKVGIGNPAVLGEVEQLIRFYREKYFGG